MAERAVVARIRTIIVDDEPRARNTIRSLLEPDEEVEVVGETYGEHSPALIAELRPDLVFLDVQMPRMNGLQVLDALETDSMPLIIFVTAYDDYAVQAFEHAAVDYLLKPFSDGRFYQALKRAKASIHRRETDLAQQRLVALLSSRPGYARATGAPRGRSQDADRLVLRDSGRMLVFPPHDICWLEARGPYVRVHTVHGAAPVVRDSLRSLEARLDPERFFRIHRSAIVNVQHVREVRALTHGDAEVCLTGGRKLKLSRTRREEFEKRLGVEGQESS